jgi:hypothetical protein
MGHCIRSQTCSCGSGMMGGAASTQGGGASRVPPLQCGPCLGNADRLVHESFESGGECPNAILFAALEVALCFSGTASLSR